jgi:hypothetical protein
LIDHYNRPWRIEPKSLFLLQISSETLSGIHRKGSVIYGARQRNYSNV